MEDFREEVIQQIDENIAAKRRLRDSLAGEIADAAALVLEALRQGGKVLLCGNGGSAADAQHIAGELVGRFAFDRRALPAMALSTDTSVLTAIGNDYGYDLVFERQVEALAKPGDVLIAISTSGNSPNVVRAVEAARGIGAKSVGLLGRDGGRLRDLVDLALVVPGTNPWRAQECHITIGHIICGIVERELFKREG